MLLSPTTSVSTVYPSSSQEDPSCRRSDVTFSREPSAFSLSNSSLPNLSLANLSLANLSSSELTRGAKEQERREACEEERARKAREEQEMQATQAEQEISSDEEQLASEEDRKGERSSGVADRGVFDLGYSGRDHSNSVVRRSDRNSSGTRPLLSVYDNLILPSNYGTDSPSNGGKAVLAGKIESERSHPSFYTRYKRPCILCIGGLLCVVCTVVALGYLFFHYYVEEREQTSTPTVEWW